MADMGLIRVPFPENVGGLGLGWNMLFEIQERLAYNAGAVASILNRLVNFSGMPVLLFGTEAQKQDILPRVLDGKMFCALALTEPDVGSDAASVKTRAVPVADGWKLQGRKTWISDADQAEYLLTLCRTADTGDDKKHLTAFLVPRRSPGISMTQIPKVGHNTMPSWDIGYDDVIVPDSLRLGERGRGMKTITGTLTCSRASMAASVVGVAQAALDLAVAYARERIQFGQPIARFQVIKHRLVDMHLEVRKAKLAVKDLARRIDLNEPVDDAASIAKIIATEALQFVTDHGMQILASAGYSAESAMQRYWRDARLYTFGEGTNEIQREIIAQHMGLG